MRSGGTRFTDALDSIKKIRKERMADLKVEREKLKHLDLEKSRAEQVRLVLILIPFRGPFLMEVAWSHLSAVPRPFLAPSDQGQARTPRHQDRDAASRGRHARRGRHRAPADQRRLPHARGRLRRDLHEAGDVPEGDRHVPGADRELRGLDGHAPRCVLPSPPFPFFDTSPCR